MSNVDEKMLRVQEAQLKALNEIAHQLKYQNQLMVLKYAPPEYLSEQSKKVLQNLREQLDFE